jgi:hypothetical protein
MTNDACGGQTDCGDPGSVDVEQTLLELEALASLPIAERPRDYHRSVHARVVALQAIATRHLSLSQHLRFLTHAVHVIADMEPETYSAIVGRAVDGREVLLAAGAAAAQALTLAGTLGEPAVTARILRLNAQVLRRLLNFPATAAAYRASIALLRRAGAAKEVGDGALAHDLLESLIRLVSVEIVLGNARAGQRRLDEAVDLARRINARGAGRADLDLPTIEWMQAMLSRQQGKDHLVRALEQALHAADAYLKEAPSVSQARILWVTTEIALDLAEEAQAAGVRDMHLDVAAYYLDLTRERAKLARDRAGMQMAILSEARYRQLRRPETTVAVNQPRGVLKRLAEQRDWDWGLAVDAYVTLGRTLLARDARDEARAAFEAAVREAGAHDSPGVAWFAERALVALRA